MLHRFSQFVVGCTVLLVLAGSLVTSTGSGLAVPDWPTSYGWNMFTFPPSKWVGGIFYEHGHRLIASTVGFLTIILAAWLWRADPRAWMKKLGVVALLAVITQGVLGGITVLYFLPDAVSTAHAALAEIFFCLTVAIALFTSRGWIQSADAVDDPTLRAVATGNDSPRLYTDHRRRRHAPQRRRAGDSRLPADVRRHRAGSLERRNRHPFHAPRRRARRGGGGAGDCRAHLVSPPDQGQLHAAGARSPRSPRRSDHAGRVDGAHAPRCRSSTARTSSAERWC